MDAQGVLHAVSLHAHPSSSKPLSTTQLRFSNPLLDLQKWLPTSPKTLRTTTTFPRIRAAISRTKKEETVEVVRQQLENCYLIAGINYQGLTVKQFQELRSSLPESVKLIVAKNTLVQKAVEGTPWEALEPCMKGMNAWMFVHTEEIPGALKQYRNFQKEKKLDTNDYTGAVFEGKFYAPTEFKALETMPTRAEIYAKFLGALQGPSSSLVSTIQAPARDIVMVLKAYVKKLEEEGSGQ
ncbi:50S ribosomal protein L10, chloroplastic [Nymphaea colorata]|uniref:Large ribosomal subunit protein uL10c n=1 Tax=Nymphaea colorata TaxID=210225 RepID=A0A5K1DGV9_9MAGN|nr:50S ribosomal protein L10, chloroplastic [Nymphaea colorata]